MTRKEKLKEIENEIRVLQEGMLKNLRSDDLSTVEDRLAVHQGKITDLLNERTKILLNGR